jgi:hypothetical protein
MGQTRTGAPCRDGRSGFSGAESIASSIKESLNHYLARAAVSVWLWLWSRTAKLCSTVERRCSNETRSARSAERRFSNEARSALPSESSAFSLDLLGLLLYLV